MARDIILEEHHQQGGRLNQFVGEQSSRVGDASRQAMRSGSVLGVVCGSLAEQRFGPSQGLWLAGIHRSLRVPDAGEVGFTVRGSRRWPQWSRMRTGELNSEFPPVAKSAQLVFEQVNIQAQRFCCADGHVLLVVRIESWCIDRDVVRAWGQRRQRVMTLLGTAGLVNRFCASVGGLNLSIDDCLAVGVDYSTGDRPAGL